MSNDFILAEGEWTVSKNLAGDLVVASSNHHDNLVAALRDLLNATEPTYDNRHERQAAQDAIAKATGEILEDNT